MLIPDNTSNCIKTSENSLKFSIIFYRFFMIFDMFNAEKQEKKR